MSLEEDAKNADKCGLTYGHYMPVKGKIKVPENFKSYNDKQEEKKMAVGIPITKDQKESITALGEKGLKTSQIARRTGLSESSVRKVIRKNKELEAVTPASSSEESINTPTEDIIPQKSEDVKPEIYDKTIKKAILTAMEFYREQIADLSKEINELEKYIKMNDEKSAQIGKEL